MNNVYPTGITANKKTNELTVVWSDRHTSIIPFSLLRSACPCEACRGGHDKMSDIPPREAFYIPIEDKPETRLLNIETVGSYAISITWEDGHQAGIYNWHYLRACCPCPICQEMMIYGQ